MSKAWNRWRRSVAIQTLYLLSASPETTAQSGLITVDSDSLHTYCTVTFLLRWTDHFPLRNGCFITLEELFTGPTWTLLTFIRQAEPQIRRNFRIGTAPSCHAWIDSIRLHPGLLSTTHRILMQCCWLPVWLIVPSTQRHSFSIQQLRRTPHARCCHLCR